MHKLVALACLCGTLLPDPARSGPWLRDKGDVFLSFGENLALSDGARLPVHHDPHVYAEWGATERLTLAFSAFSGDAGRETTVQLNGIMALPVSLIEGDRMSVSFGVAGRQIDGITGVDTLVQGGLAWGMGLPDGWVTAEASVALRASDGGAEGKIDVTWGRTLSERWTGMIQFSAGNGHTDDFYAKISPSAAFTLNDSIRLTIGVTQGLTGDQGTGLSLGTWIEF